MSDRPELIGNRQTSNKPDWTAAPEDAQFYSCGHFRKHENGVEYVWADDWEAVTVDPIDWHKKTTDFEMRPESSEPEWDGKGFPPAGTPREVTASSIGISVAVKSKRGDVVFDYIYDAHDVGILHPIKSGKDNWIDKAVDLLKPAMGGLSEEERDICSLIYDALKSGKLPTP